MNAEKAKKLIDVERDKRLKPLDDELVSFIEKLEEQRQANFEKIESQILEFKSKIQELKQNVLNEVKEINEDKGKLIVSKEEQLKIIEESEETEIVKLIELLDSRKTELDKLYNETLILLQDKDEEAKKIYEYEKRIYNIALETATSRFNDANVKTENANFLCVSSNTQEIETIKKDSDKFIRDLNYELLELTKKFEKNIFTTRPRLEESIGDAQKAIETEIIAKQKRLANLQESHSKITQSLENTLYTSFQEGYERLIQNLNYYLDKYKVIGDGYNTSNDLSNSVISENNTAFTNALFELGNKKHNEVKQKLIDININIT